MKLFILVAALCSVGDAIGQERSVQEHDLVFKAGPAFERSLNENATTFGGTLGVEVTPIEHWLELELSVTRLRSSGRRDDSVELQFKKPFQLSSTAELMIGVGPASGRNFSGGTSSKARAVDVSVDLMVWPTPKVGWFLEPTYGHGIGPSRGGRAIGASAGLLIGW